MSIRALLKPFVPSPLLRLYNAPAERAAERRAREAATRQRQIYQGMTTAEVFNDVYARNLWGGKQGEYYSGAGSADAAVTGPYVSAVTRWLDSIDAQRLTIVDLGCGDFTVGRQIAASCGQYVGVDIVGGLIEHHRQTHGKPGVSFECRNIIEDDLPTGDVCFVRQVLQHLSNEQILRVLAKVRRYQWAVISEHYPSPDRFRAKNLDKPHGWDTRVDEGSAVYLDAPPFNLPSANLRLLAEVFPSRSTHEQDSGVIRTYLLERGVIAADN